MRTLLVIKLGSTYSWVSREIGDFDDWIITGMRAFPGKILAVSPPLGQPLPPPGEISGAVLTGSHSMVTSREKWSEDTVAWLVEALRLEIPLLGICYGHQLLARAAGGVGVVGYNPRGREFGTTEVRLLDKSGADPIFSQLPSPLRVHVCHAQSVLELPPGAIPLASNTHDPHHAFRIGRNAWGVQFHPEFQPAAARAYIEHHAEDLRAEGQDPQKLLDGVRDTPDSGSILQKFAEFVAVESGGINP
ncbi:MAG: glutamine amidotransferase [Syntrophobacteraceae bacterium]